ncbi:MAG: zf-HC2 domain-containing protein [Acidobacteriota bacterium]|nr:zf-HC2 domain-containing protein [Acidobacteriota bacterium]
MNCKSCRKMIFDRRDGSLAERDEAAIKIHLLDCAACREFYDEEKIIGGRIEAAFNLAEAPHVDRVPASAAPGRKYRRRFPRSLIPAAAGTAVLAAVLLLLPSRPAWVIEPTSPEPVVLDDFPDPLRDWVEGRLIVTVEDSQRGTRETFLATRDGSIRRVAEKGKIL